jgi:predicted NUDIX family NTP pyrophosphohydrolase
MQEFPEVDRVAWFGLDSARAKLVSAQRDLLDRLVRRLGE